MSRVGICLLLTTALYVGESYFSSVYHYSVVDLDHKHFKSFFNHSFKIRVQMDFVLKSLFIGDRSPMKILYFQLIICVFGD